MFGYILPEKPEMKIREYELFNAYYCGICKSIARRYGQIHRFTLNYDATFLALLLSSLVDEKENLRIERCIAHPIKKKPMHQCNKMIDYASDINILLTYFKLKDNWKDESSVISAAGMLILQGGYKRFKKENKEKCRMIEDQFIALAKIEKNQCSSLDQAAEPFAKIMEEVFAYDLAVLDENKAKILRWIGYNIGKWIYVLDAFDDIAEDIKMKTYNPLLLQFNFLNENVEEFKKRIKERVEFILTYALSEITKGYHLLDVKKNAPIIENIIFMGMLRKTENILEQGLCKIEKSI